MFRVKPWTEKEWIQDTINQYPPFERENFDLAHFKFYEFRNKEDKDKWVSKSPFVIWNISSAKSNSRNNQFAWSSLNKFNISADPYINGLQDVGNSSVFQEWNSTSPRSSSFTHYTKANEIWYKRDLHVDTLWNTKFKELAIENWRLNSSLDSTAINTKSNFQTTYHHTKL